MKNLIAAVVVAGSATVAEAEPDWVCKTGDEANTTYTRVGGVVVRTNKLEIGAVETTVFQCGGNGTCSIQKGDGAELIAIDPEEGLVVFATVGSLENVEVYRNQIWLEKVTCTQSNLPENN